MAEIYLDYNATTPLEPRVREAMMEVLGEALNASSTHRLGRKARAMIEAARPKIAALVGVPEARVVFTASGTEANNLALRGFEGNNIFVSAIEHPSVLKAGMKAGAMVVPATADGVIDTKALERLLALNRGKSLISVMLANNETGIVQPVQAVVEVAKRFGALVHTDASQCIGKIPVDMAALEVDMMTISAHKFGGPQGAAALILKKGVSLAPHIIGGGQEQNLRAGTEDVAAIHGLGVAAAIIAGAGDTGESVKKLRDRLEASLKDFAPETAIIGAAQERLPNTSCIAMPGVGSETQLIHFDMAHVAVSAGSACSSGKIEVSHVLKAMQVPDDVAKTAIRVSFGKGNTEDDVDAFLFAWKHLYENNRKQQAA